VIEALTWASLALAAAGSLSVCTLAARRLLVARSERKRRGIERRLTPVALALLAGEPAALDELGESETEILAALLARYSARVRGDETRRIARFFEERGGLQLELERLRDRRAWRRATGAFALGDMASPQAVPGLLDTLADEAASVRAAAARSLGRLGAVEAVGPLVHGFARGNLTRAVAGQALLAVGPAATPVLRELEDAPEWEARAFALELLGLLGNATDGQRVVPKLRDTSAEVRAKAARALGRLGAKEATGALVARLDDRIAFVRVAAAHALAAVGDRSAVPPLLHVARGHDFDAARAAAAAAAQLDPDAVRNAAASMESGPYLAEAADILGARR